MNHRRSIRQHSQCCSLSPGELCGRMSEITPRCGIKPHYISPERGMRSIKGKDFRFRVSTFETRCQYHLNQLFSDRSAFSTRETNRLHRQRTSPTYHSSSLDILHQRSPRRQRVNTPVPVIITVFKSNQALCELLRYRIAHRKTPLSVGCDPGTEQLAVAIGHHGGVGSMKQSTGKAE